MSSGLSTFNVSINISSLTSPGSADYHPALHVIYLVILILSTVTGNIGNLMVIGSVTLDKRLHSPGTMFVVNLALADLCVTVFVDPFSIVGAFENEKYFQVRANSSIQLMH